MCTMPCGTCFFSFFLKVFFLPFLSAVAAPAPAAATGFAIFSSIEVRAHEDVRAYTNLYVLAAVFFLFATVPLRGPLRVRALVWVRCPRTGRLRRGREPRDEPISVGGLIGM